MEWLLLGTAVAAAANAGVHLLRHRHRRLSFPVTTLVLAGITAVLSVADNLSPDLLASLDRDRDALLAGQWWRLVTPLVVQDGGWAGTAFNLLTLVVVGALVETLHGRRTLLAVYLLAGIVSEIAAYTVLPEQGYAGNSVANLGLTALCLVTCVAATRTLAQLFGVIGLIAGAVLGVTADLHGVGFAVDLVAGTVVVVRGRRQPDAA